MRGIVYSVRLIGLAGRLRRYGALRALRDIEMIPPWVITALRLVTLWVPRRARLPKTRGERLAAALASMGPAYIKLGQTLAMRPDLVGRPLAEGLMTLQDRLPAFSGDQAVRIVESELGGAIGDHFQSFDRTAVAAASIAQVHKAVTTDGRQVAVKVLRPGIEARFGRDIALFEGLADIAERHSAEARRLRLLDVAAEVRRLTEREMDLRMEAASATELASNMAGELGYRIPSVEWELSSKRVMTLEWVDGIRIGDRDALVAAGHDVDALAARIVQIFLKQAMRDGYFHADLHQGNVIVEPGGTLVAIDFGIMGRLGRKERYFLAEILFCFITGNYVHAAEVHFEAGYVPRGQDVGAFAEALRAIAEPIRDVPVEEISGGKLLAQLFATTERFQMRARPELIMLQRTMVMAEGMALHLNPKTNMWETSRPVIEDWVKDNLSPEVRLADMINQLPRIASRLWYFINRDEPEPAPPPPVIVARHGLFWPLLAVGLLITLILT